MESDHWKIALAGAWILGIGTLGYVSGVTSFTAWLGLAVLALAPPVVMARLWSSPAASMSERIREVLR